VQSKDRGPRAADFTRTRFVRAPKTIKHVRQVVAGDPDASSSTSPATNPFCAYNQNANVTALRRVFDRIVDQAEKQTAHGGRIALNFHCFRREFS